MSKEQMIDNLIYRYGFENDLVIDFAQACEALANTDEFNTILYKEYIQLMS